MGEIHSDTSVEESEVDKEEEKKQVTVAKVKMSQMTPYEQEEHKARIEEEKKKPPLPTVTNKEKFDKVFILPLFCKPGKH